MALILSWPAVSLRAVQDEKFFLLLNKGGVERGLPRFKKKPAARAQQSVVPVPGVPPGACAMTVSEKRDLLRGGRPGSTLCTRLSPSFSCASFMSEWGRGGGGCP